MTNTPPLAQADLQKMQGTAVKEKTKDLQLIQFINLPGMKSQLANALPKHLTAERMIRIVTTEIRKNPDLGLCNRDSFIGAVVQCAQLGLEPGNALGHAYLLPFKKNKRNSDGTWVVERIDVQLIIGYRGMIDLARRSGQIVSISARAVREGDRFHYEYGLSETLTHVPCGNDDAPVSHVYAVARLKDGGTQFEVMSRQQINKVAAQSKSVKTNKDGSINLAETYSPWATHWEEMAKKTAIRKIFKYLPVSIEIQKAVVLDEKAESDIDQEHAAIFEAEFEEVSDERGSE
ncbi:recombination protein RecT [Xenorhabdus bovienii]|uniref:recombination protein RecT n=1 Tax=Xenorhabdus bovienii TaxID=40576 RepID=UPI0023B2F086|nr:recombination protein RecT [Xenorhabdus bovienii]MDE9455687.1 recombination protein RecT [Xenorhabdus bovienii]